MHLGVKGWRWRLRGRRWMGVVRDKGSSKVRDKGLEVEGM